MCKKILLLLSLAILTRSILAAQPGAGRKIDTTMKAGKTGYRVTCTNKKADKNLVSISPVGFGKDARDFSFEVRGILGGTEADDLNHDGYLDLVVYIFSTDSTHKGSVMSVINQGNETLASAVFPDILDDTKLRIGYKGYDSLYLMEGTVMRRFPLYDSSSTGNKSSVIQTRVVQYNVVPGEAGRYKFTPLRSYVVKKQ